MALKKDYKFTIIGKDKLEYSDIEFNSRVRSMTLDIISKLPNPVSITFKSYFKDKLQQHLNSFHCKEKGIVDINKISFNGDDTLVIVNLTIHLTIRFSTDFTRIDEFLAEAILDTIRSYEAEYFN